MEMRFFNWLYTNLFVWLPIKCEMNLPSKSFAKRIVLKMPFDSGARLGEDPEPFSSNSWNLISGRAYN